MAKKKKMSQSTRQPEKFEKSTEAESWEIHGYEERSRLPEYRLEIE